MAIVKHYSEAASQTVTVDGAKNTSKRILIGQNDGAPNFSIRMFEIEPNGNTPSHSHDFEHEIFILEGNGTLIAGENEFKISRGTAVLIPPLEEHSLVNNGKAPLCVLCMVPKEFE